jgi:hypothetical protein
VCISGEDTCIFEKKEKIQYFLNRGKTYKDPAFIPTINEGVF